MSHSIRKILSRVKLTPLCVEDAGEMLAILVAPEIYEFIPEEPPRSLDELQTRYQSLVKGGSPDGSESWLNWIVRNSTSNAAMGYVQATVSKETRIAQVAYVLNPRYWGQGYAHEAVLQMLFLLARDYRVPAFEAAIDRLNQRSIKLLERIGFTKSGEKPTELADGTASRDVIMELPVPASGLNLQSENGSSSETRRTFSGVLWEKRVGYCRALKCGRFISVSGTAPVDDRGAVFEPGNACAQTKRCINIIEKALIQLGSALSEVVRTRMFVTDISRWEEYGKAHAEAFGCYPPATSMVEVKALIAPGMLIEIEADAVTT